MKMFGIIGGIGSGKSTVSALFRQRGAEVIDADAIGHQVLLLPEVQYTALQRWGTEIFAETEDVIHREIDRQKLAAIVFAQRSELDYLEMLMHPLIAKEINRQRQNMEQSGVPMGLLDAPLLLEACWDHLVDKIIFVKASAKTRWQRIKSRGWSIADWQRREASQFPLEKKECRADWTLDNSRDIDFLREQIEVLLSEN